MVCCIYHDRQRVWRDVLREYEWYYEDRPHTAEYLKFDVLVTTYDTLIGDFDVISQIPFRVAVVDEAHRLRNQKGKLLECMREISAKGTMQYGYQSRVLMSGTPLQNDLTVSAEPFSSYIALVPPRHLNHICLDAFLPHTRNCGRYSTLLRPSRFLTWTIFKLALAIWPTVSKLKICRR